MYSDQTNYRFLYINFPCELVKMDKKNSRNPIKERTRVAWCNKPECFIQ